MELAREVPIRRPVGEVFAFLADPWNPLTWNQPPGALRATSPGPMGLNETFAGTYPRVGQVDVRVTVFEPPRAMAFVGGGKSLEIGLLLEFIPIPVGTLVRLRADARFRGMLGLATGAMRGTIERAIDEQIGQIVQAVESAAPRL